LEKSFKESKKRFINFVIISFQDFRRKVSDLIKDVAFIVGSGACFKQMFHILQAPETTWESTEAALFIMQNVAKNILPYVKNPIR